MRKLPPDMRGSATESHNAQSDRKTFRREKFGMKKDLTCIFIT